MKLTRDAWNLRATVLWGLLAMLGLAVAYALGTGPILGVVLFLAARLAYDFLVTWMLGPPPPKDTPP